METAVPSEVAARRGTIVTREGDSGQTLGPLQHLNSLRMEAEGSRLRNASPLSRPAHPIVAGREANDTIEPMVFD